MCTLYFLILLVLRPRQLGCKGECEAGGVNHAVMATQTQGDLQWNALISYV